MSQERVNHESTNDLISRADAIEAVGEAIADGCSWYDALSALPSADKPTLNQTDTLIIADALRYLAKDEERHELDRTRAEELREQILQYGASMCHPAEAEPTVVRSRTLMPTKDFKEWARRVREVNPNAVVIPCDAEVVSAEAVQGEWIHDGQNFKGGLDWCHCSVCGQKTSANGLRMYRFCPNCGAKMRKEKP